MWLYLICIIYINDLFILKDTDKKHHYYEDTVRFSHLFLLLSFSEWKALCQVLGIELISLDFTAENFLSLPHYLVNSYIFFKFGRGTHFLPEEMG